MPYKHVIEIFPSSENKGIKVCDQGCKHCSYAVKGTRPYGLNIQEVSCNTLERLQQIFLNRGDNYDLYLSGNIDEYSDNGALPFILSPDEVSVVVGSASTEEIDELIKKSVENVNKIFCNLQNGKDTQLGIGFTPELYNNSENIFLRDEYIISIIKMFVTIVSTTRSIFSKNSRIILTNNFINEDLFERLKEEKYSFLKVLEFIGQKTVNLLYNDISLEDLDESFLTRVDKEFSMIKFSYGLGYGYDSIFSIGYRGMVGVGKIPLNSFIPDALSFDELNLIISLYPDCVRIGHHAKNINYKELEFTYNEFLKVIENVESNNDKSLGGALYDVVRIRMEKR